MGRFLKFAVLASATLHSAVLAAVPAAEPDLEAPITSLHEFDPRAPCASDQGGAHIIVARGSTEPPGMGALGEVAALVQAGIPGTTAMGINYPAVLSPYQWSVNEGTTAMTKDIEDYVGRCPRARIILMGYSQGAQVVMNTICGTSENSFTDTPQLPRHLWKHIARVMVYADLSHLVNKKYDAGTAYTDGVFPRLNPRACRPFRNRIRSYCDDGDVWCASGDNPYVHTSYFSIYNTDASNWLIRTTKKHLPWLHKGRHHHHRKHHHH